MMACRCSAAAGTPAPLSPVSTPHAETTAAISCSTAARAAAPHGRGAAAAAPSAAAEFPGLISGAVMAKKRTCGRMRSMMSVSYRCACAACSSSS